MENQLFRNYLNRYLEIWRNSSLPELKELLSKDYKAREIRAEGIVDFGYEESINGWEQGFNFAKENIAHWNFNEISILTLRDDEKMVVLSATLDIEGKSLETANLFFQTFKKDASNDWKLVRSYIESGIPTVNIKSLQINY